MRNQSDSEIREMLSSDADIERCRLTASLHSDKLLILSNDRPT